MTVRLLAAAILALAILLLGYGLVTAAGPASRSEPVWQRVTGIRETPHDGHPDGGTGTSGETWAPTSRDTSRQQLCAATTPVAGDPLKPPHRRSPEPEKTGPDYCGVSLILEPAVPTQPIPRAQPDQPAAVAVTVSKNRLTGIASWGNDWSGVVTRLPRGTAICVAGALGRWCGPSVGYGPAVWTGRIADLSGTVFRDICGPTSMGLCTVVLTW